MTRYITVFVALVFVSIVFLKWGPPQVLRGSARTVSAFMYDAWDLGSWGDPNQPLKQEWRGQRRTGINIMADHLHKNVAVKNPLVDSDSTAGDNLNMRAAVEGRRLHQKEQLWNATLEGRTTSTPMAIKPWAFWTPVIADNGKQLEVRQKTMVNVSGCMYGASDQSDPLYRCVGPEGWTEAELRTIRANWVFDFGRNCQAMPYLSVCGRIKKDDGTYGPEFYVGPGMIIDPDAVGYGLLELGIAEINRNQFNQPMNGQLNDNNVGGNSFTYAIKPV